MTPHSTTQTRSRSVSFSARGTASAKIIGIPDTTHISSRNSARGSGGYRTAGAVSERRTAYRIRFGIGTPQSPSRSEVGARAGRIDQAHPELVVVRRRDRGRRAETRAVGVHEPDRRRRTERGRSTVVGDVGGLVVVRALAKVVVV